ncbi:putative reverse transcriptase domain-containing protein [Tanacetum coccineum]
MMTTEYCPGTKVYKMEQELWMLTLKRYDIKGYNNRFHELALMCHDLVTPERKKIKRYVWGLSERVKANVTFSKPANLHEAINMARERHEAAKAYMVAPAEGRGYARNLPLCNKCKLHHLGQCSVKCRKCKRIGHQTKDCWSKTSAADTPPTADANALGEIFLLYKT